jgi:hypothetical protein
MLTVGFSTVPRASENLAEVEHLSNGKHHDPERPPPGPENPGDGKRGTSFHEKNPAC